MTLTITDYAPYADAVKKPSTYTLGEGVKHMVDSSPDYHDGQMEALARKVEVLTEIVGKMADALESHIGDEGVRAIIGYPLMIEEDNDGTD
jgi:hypothetical protein